MESRVRATVAVCVAVLATSVGAQTPQPFPRANQPAQTPAPAQTQPRPADPTTRPLRPPASAPGQVPPPAATTTTPRPAAPAAPDAAAPTAQSLGLPLYPAAQYIGTFDAGRGQKYVLFGTAAAFLEIVNYYRAQLDDKGDLVFRDPPTHTFEVGRFREETMAFPPGVTVKDFTSGGSKGYPNPKLNGQPERFATVIMLVPAPAAAPPQRR